jgi:2-succinyl-5-enolpyruvyl-6-hydroxy-3-cyclohexene-1-carboxylate synthase
MLTPDPSLKKILANLSQNCKTVILTETTSNLTDKNFINSIDRTIDTINVQTFEKYKPDLLITIGNPVISKKIKNFFRNNQPTEHWHIEETEEITDTYQSLTYFINTSPQKLLSYFLIEKSNSSNDFYESWHQLNNNNLHKHREYLASAPYCDLKVFEAISDKLPDNSVVHLGNSSPVRYIQLFNQKENIEWYSNRGTSGIDGCTSTAAGAAYIRKEKLNILITGDISFLYDSNALWNNYLENNLKIIVINNKGGGIFRIIDRPEKEDELQKLFETRHQMNLKKLVEAFGIDYRFASDTSTLNNELDQLFKPNNKPVVLEIETNPELNDKILKNYFEHLKKQS